MKTKMTTIKRNTINEERERLLSTLSCKATCIAQAFLYGKDPFNKTPQEWVEEFDHILADSRRLDDIETHLLSPRSRVV